MSLFFLKLDLFIIDREVIFMPKIYVKIDGMHCSHCENVIKNALLSINNIKDVSFYNYIACITYSGYLSKKKVIKSINDIGYITNDTYISDNINDLKDNIKLYEFILISFFIVILFFILYKIFGYNIFNVIPEIDSSVSYSMLFVIGLLTSIHCISMCGAINLMSVVGNNNNIKRPLLYNVGRVISYTIIGGIVGLLGGVIYFNDIISGIIILISAIIMLFMALNMLGILKVKSIHYKYKLRNKNPFVIGLFNGLMPCGPLQAMQVYALSTGSFISGAFSMFVFGIGTVPLMLFTGLLVNVLKKRWKIIINKIASVLILILSFIMISRGISTLGFNVNSIFNSYGDYTASVIKGGYQEVNIDLSYSSYDDIIVQKGIKVKLIINVSKEYLTGCNNEIVIGKYSIKKHLKSGENIIWFMPSETGEYTMNCWMNMINNTIKVIDNRKYFRKD